MPIEVRDEHCKTDMNKNERDSDVLCLRLPPKLEINNLPGLLKTIFSGNSVEVHGIERSKTYVKIIFDSPKSKKYILNRNQWKPYYWPRRQGFFEFISEDTLHIGEKNAKIDIPQKIPQFFISFIERKIKHEPETVPIKVKKEAKTCDWAEYKVKTEHGVGYEGHEGTKYYYNR